MSELPNLVPALPEIFLAVAAMALMMIGVYRGKESTDLAGGLAMIALVTAGFLELKLSGGRILTFNGMFVVDQFAVFCKLLVLAASVLTLAMSIGWMRREGVGRFEYPVLVLFATLGMMMMVSAHDLIALYMGLELQSLSLYVIAAYNRDSARSTEAGLKYFVLGALASGMLLFGASYLYGFTGSTNFEILAKTLGEEGNAGAGVIIGLVFVVAGLAFKMAAVPFHMWAPDVYEGAPTPMTAFFAVAPKMAAVALFLRVVQEPFGGLFGQWQQLVVALSVGSMVLGAFAAIAQTNIKRMMAYSSIGHIGYALIGMAVGNASGVRSVLIYMAIYLAMNVGVFAVIISMRHKGRGVEDIDDLAGLSKTNPLVALALAILMFSMAGIPPMAGFLGKFYVFMTAVEAHMYTLAVIGVLTSAVGAYYYLRIIKIMYFDEPVEALDKPVGTAVSLVLAGSSVFVMFFFLHPAPLIAGAEAAAASLFAG